MYHFRRCPICRAYLDPGERCDCQDKETAPDAANIEGGKAEQKSDQLNRSASEYKPN